MVRNFIFKARLAGFLSFSNFQAGLKKLVFFFFGQVAMEPGNPSLIVRVQELVAMRSHLTDTEFKAAKDDLFRPSPAPTIASSSSTVSRCNFTETCEP